MADIYKKLPKRLAVNPAAMVRKGRRSLRRVVQPQSLGFPYVSPSWPDSVPRNPIKRELEGDYDTAWARKWGVRVARALVVDNIARPAVSFLTSPQIEGLDRLDRVDGPVIFAPNHASHLDLGVLLAVLPSRFRHKMVAASGADYFFDTKLKAALAAGGLSAVPMERHKVGRRSAELLQKLLGEGWSVVLFPEGSRTPDGWMHSYQGGAAYLAEKCGVPVVPIYIGGTRRLLPKGKSVPKVGKVIVTFGRPMWAREGENYRKMAGRLEAEAQVLADEAANGFWVARQRAAAGTTPSKKGPSDAATWRRAWMLGGGRKKGAPKPKWPEV